MEYRFELLRGVHSEGIDAKGNPRVYDVGDVIETDNNLSRHNLPGIPARFRLLNLSKQSSPQEENQDTSPKRKTRKGE